MISTAQGISLAIPANTAKWVVGELIAKGKVERAYLGIVGQIVPISKFIQHLFQLKLPTGVSIIRVEKKSPAYNAGVYEGDLIFEADDQEIGNIDDLHRILSKKSAHSVLSAKLFRDNKLKELKISLEIRRN